MVILALIGSVLVGVILGFLLKERDKIAKLSLTFSGSFLLTITVLDLFPELYTTGIKSIGLYVLLGVFVQILLDFITKGADHGHVHSGRQKKMPYLVFLGLFLHAFLEGAPIKNIQDHLLWAIVVHNIPIAMILYFFLDKLSTNKLNNGLILIVFALASPFGYWLGSGFLEMYHKQIMAVVSGVFLHISTIILFESSEKHQFNLQKLLALILGFLIAYQLIS